MSAWPAFDPPPVSGPAQFEGETLLERVARAYEEAVDAYGDACDDNAAAENVYLLRYAVAWAHAVEDGIPATTRAKHCENVSDVVAARVEWNRKAAAEKRCKAKVAELQTRMTAAMSHIRFLREGS